MVSHHAYQFTSLLIFPCYLILYIDVNLEVHFDIAFLFVFVVPTAS